jgi:biopolymer transport protein ExbB
MKKEKELANNSLNKVFSALVIPIALVAALVIYIYILGNGVNFMGGSNKNLPIPGNVLGTIYKGGYIVPILMTLLITVIAFTLERFFTINKASGRGSVVRFVQNIRSLLNQHKINEASELCDRQRGSVANVIKAGLIKYQDVEKDSVMSKDQKLVAIQKEVEEATTLELPSLEANLVILATISSIATLLGLLGTVLGMIKAFTALAQAGAPDSATLSVGISEALINTAFGIGTAALAIIFYNVFTTKIDKLTYAIDEAGFTITQTYAANHN